MKRLTILLTILLCLWHSGLFAAEMVTVELEPGIYNIPTVTVPTRFVSTERWRAILEPADDLPYCLNLYADCIVEGCQIRFATSDKGDRRVGGGGTGVFAHAACSKLTLNDCFIHHCTDNGIYTTGNTLLTMNRCLVEYNGSHGQFSHGAYVNSRHFSISSCLFLHNAHYGLAATGDAEGVVYKSVFYGDLRNTTIVHEGRRGAVAILECTLFGIPPFQRTPDGEGTEPIPLHRSNLYYPNSQDKVDNWELTRSFYNLWMPRAKMNPPRGAYDFYPELRTREQAKRYWREGFMTGWCDENYVSQHPYPFPLFPGDRLPEIQE
jgi:hypothetical protein